MASLELKGVKKIYPGGVVAVKDFNLTIDDREFIVLVGPSGCGKSTTLRMIAGLEDISEGELYIDGTLVNGLCPKDRDIAMVFQNYALYPHMTVYDNMAFGLKLRKVPGDVIEKRVRAAAEILGIEDLLHRKPKALSGGQRQRVALGRVIVREPRVFLMDEPLSNLDAKLRVQMRAEIAKLHNRLKTTFIYVTHDQTEAMTMGTRIVIMNGGEIQQIDAPKALYDRPVNMFVAGFIGSPQMNFLPGTVVEEDGVLQIRLPDGSVLGVSEERERKLKEGGYVGREVVAGIRPESLHESEVNPTNSTIRSSTTTTRSLSELQRGMSSIAFTKSRLKSTRSSRISFCAAECALSTLNSNSARTKTAPYFSPMRFRRIRAVFGTQRRTKSSTKTAFAAISAMSKKPMSKCSIASKKSSDC